MCLLSPSEKIRRRAFLRSFHRNEFLRKVVIEYRIPSFPYNINIIEFVYASDVLASPILSPHRKFLLGRVSLNNFNLIKQRMVFLSARKLNFSVQYDDDKSLSELLREPKKSFLIPSSSFCFFKLKLFTIAMRVSAEIISPYGEILSQSGFLEFVLSS